MSKMTFDEYTAEFKRSTKEIESLAQAGEIDKGIALAKKIYKLALKYKDIDDQANAIYNLALMKFYKYEYANAIDDCQKALAISESTGHDKNNALVLNLLSIIYKRTGLYEKSLDCLFKALEFAEKINDTQGVSMITCNIGSTYSNLHLYEKALKYCKKALTLSKKSDDFGTIYYCINTIGAIYSETKNYTQALKYAKQALKLATKKGLLLEVTRTLLNLATVHSSIKDYDKVKYYLKKTIDHSYKSNAIDQRAWAMVTLAKYYSEVEKQFTLAKETLEDAKKVIDFKKVRGLYQHYLRTCNEMYRLTEDYKNAYEIQKKMLDFNAETFNEENIKKIASLEASFEIKQKEKEAEIYRLKNVELARANKQLATLNEELIKANQQLKIAHESKDGILRIVSHDLKNVITVVSQTLEIVRYQETSEKTNRHLETMDIATNRAIRLVKDILEANEIENPDYTLDLQPVNIDEHILSLTDMFAQACEQKSIKFYTDLNAQNAIAHIHPDKFWQILNNLIHNAIKFTHHQGEISIRTTMTENQVLIKVVDTGVGIAPEFLPILFNKFTQAKRKGTDGESTTGIGLSIVKRLTELHHAEITVTSEVDKGTEFCLKLPKKAISK